MSGTVIPINPGMELAAIENHGSAVASLVDSARTHRIVDDVSRAMAADIRGALKQAERRIDDTRTALVKPLNDHVSAINARFKPMSRALFDAIATIDREIIRDRRDREAAAERERRRLAAEAEAKRQEAEEDRRRLAEAEAATTAAAARAAGMNDADARELGNLYRADKEAEPLPPIIQAAPPPPPARVIVSSAGSTAGVSKLWDFELLDVCALAAAYPEAVEVRRAKVLDLARAFEREGVPEKDIERAIPGVRAFKRDSVSG